VAFATAYPETFSSLVDSYNTRESGLKNFMLVSLVLSTHGYTPLSIRLDSGDLTELSKCAKALFREVGEAHGFDFSGIKVVASNDINEKAIR
jgi:nicotinate phosphoribosyltransferase